MPIYEYECESCDKVHTVYQKLSESKLKNCPECGSPNIRKLISACSFQLKGSGWFKDGYSKDKAKPEPSTATPAIPDITPKSTEPKPKPPKLID